MLQTFLTPEKLWPGGIPPSVHLHQNGDLSEDDMKEESKGWCQFVEEEWVPKTDLTEETQQRRALIERWASADEAFRDSYQDRAPLRKSPLDYPPHLLSDGHVSKVKRFFCLASVDKKRDAENYQRLIKLLVLLYFHDNKGSSHPRAYNDWESPQLPYVLADASTTPNYTASFSYQDLLSNLYLHPADFRVISMIRFGTVIFPNEEAVEEYMVIDQNSLMMGGWHL